MIIDFHTHTFPEKIEKKAISILCYNSGLVPYIKGTVDGLVESMRQSGVDYSVILPIVTNPAQLDTINSAATTINELYEDKGIISFGSIHPDNSNYSDVIKSIAHNGIKGIKFHPVYQEVPFDDIRYKRIISCACDNDLIIQVHGGYDIGFPGVDFASPSRIKNVINDTKPEKMIMAHMGGWGYWNEIEEMLNEYKLLMDTSFSITKVRKQINQKNITTVTNDNTMKIGGIDTVEDNSCLLSNEQFVRLVRLAGAQNVFYGSDSPWSMQSEAIDAVKQSGLDDSEIKLILGENAAKLLL